MRHFNALLKIPQASFSTPAAKPKDGAHLELDSPTFAPVWNVGWAGRSDLIGRVVLGFRLATREALDERFEQLTSNGYRPLQPPFDAFWGARYAIVEGPDDIAVGLMSPIDPTRQSRPPEEWTG